MGYVYVVFVVFVTALCVVRWVQHSQEKANAIRAVENAVWQHGLAFTSPHDAATVTVAGEGVVGTGATEYRLGSASPADARELGRVARLDCMLAVPDVIVCARAIAPAVFGAFVPHAMATGNVEFDQHYGVFFASGSGMRVSQQLASWLTPAVMRECLTSNLIGLQAISGRVTIAVAHRVVTANGGHVELCNAVRILSAIRSALSASNGGLPVTSTLAAPASGPQAESAPAVSDVVVVAATVLVSIAATVVGTIPQFLGLNSVVCPDGGWFSSGRGSHRNECILEVGGRYHASMWPATVTHIACVVLVCGAIFSYITRQHAARLRAAARILQPVGV